MSCRGSVSSSVWTDKLLFARNGLPINSYLYLSASRLHGEWAFDPTALHWDGRRPSSPASRLLPGPPYNREDGVHTKPWGHAVQHQSSWDSSTAREQHEGHVSMSVYLRKTLRKRKKMQRNIEAWWGKCLYHIILCIHIHPVHISCNKQHWKNLPFYCQSPCCEGSC